jgi:hypothetical protein
VALGFELSASFALVKQVLYRFAPVILEMVSGTIFPGWPGAKILLISAFQVGGLQA